MNPFRLATFIDAFTVNERPGIVQADRCDALDRIVRQFVKRRGGDVTRRDDDGRVAVRFGARHDLGADRAAGAAAVIDDKLLAELL